MPENVINYDVVMSCLSLTHKNKKNRNSLPMKIEIKIEADKDTLERIQKHLGAVAAGVSTVVKIFENFEFSLKNKSESKGMEPLSENLTGVTEKNISEQDTISQQEPLTDKPKEMNSTEEPVPATIPSVEAVATDANEPTLDTDEISCAKPEAVPEKKIVPSKPVSRKKAPRKTKKTSKAGAVKKSKPRVTAQQTVLRHIKKSKNGLNSTEIQAKTGFNAKKVADAVYQLKKKGLIEKQAKGIFVVL